MSVFNLARYHETVLQNIYANLLFNCCGINVGISPNSHGDSDGFGDEVLVSHESAAFINGISALTRRGTGDHPLPCEVARKSTGQPTLPAPRVWTSTLQNGGELDACCLRHPGCGGSCRTRS